MRQTPLRRRTPRWTPMLDSDGDAYGKQLRVPPFTIERSFEYGWHLWIGPRIRYGSPASCTRMRPMFYKGGDESCNDTIALHAWPLGDLVVWWRWRQRTEADGRCDRCRAEDLIP